MPRIIITEGATAIRSKLSQLEQAPNIGRPLNDEPKIRECLIPFGDSGNVALYVYEEKTETVYILAFRHQKEAGY